MSDATTQPQTITCEQGLDDCTSQETLDHLHVFGEMLVSEMRDRTNVIDSKALSILGWATALMAFLLVGQEQWVKIEDRWDTAVTAVATVGAVGAMVSSVMAFAAGRLRSGWQWPSEQDWLRADLFNDSIRLRRYHLFALLDTHRAHRQRNEEKARQAMWAQHALIAATLLIALALAIRIVEAVATSTISP